MSRILLFDALKIRQEIIPKRLLNKGIKKPRLKFNIGLALNGLRTTGPCSAGHPGKLLVHPKGAHSRCDRQKAGRLTEII